MFEGLVILFDTGYENNKRLINMSEYAECYPSQHCSALLGLHAFTGCDSTSAFKQVGKIKPNKVLDRNPRYTESFAMLGESWEVDESLYNELEAFTCRMYGQQNTKKVDEVRLQMMKKKCGEVKLDKKKVDMALLPPCNQTLMRHIKRANYQVCIWKRGHIPMTDIPLPTDNHPLGSHCGLVVAIYLKNLLIYLEQVVMKPQIQMMNMHLRWMSIMTHPGHQIVILTMINDIYVN